MLTSRFSPETAGFFLSIFESSKLYALIISATDGTILTFNSVFQHEYGYTLDMLVGKKLEVLFREEDRAAGMPERELQNVRQYGVAIDKNYLVHASGVALWTNGETIAVTNVNGETFYVKTIQNLDREKKLENKLKSANSVMEKMLQAVSDAVVVVDESGNILKVNSAFEELFEFTFQEGMHISDLYTQGGTEELGHGIHAIFQDEILQVSDTFVLIRQNGKKRLIRYEAFFFEEDVIKKPTRLIIFKDETLKRLQAKRNKDALVFIAHEIKNPITRVNLAIEAIRIIRQSGDTGRMDQFLDILYNTSDQLSSLLSELTDVASAGINKLSINSEDVSYDQFVHHVITRLKQTFPETKMNVTGSVGISVRLDTQRIGQVLENLVGNAIKYAGKEGPVDILLKLQDRNIVTTVRDYGAGIPADDIPFLFNRHFRTTQSQHKAKGLGFGLYLCKAIIRAHGGEIVVNSEPGKGSAFIFTLPVWRSGT